MEYCAAVTATCDAQETYEEATKTFRACEAAERAAFLALCEAQRRRGD